MQNYFRKIIFCTLIPLLSLSSLSAQTASEFFELGKKAYEVQNFQKAKEDFESAARLGYGAVAYHNAANANVKLGHLGEAMLDYERARYLNPRMPETLANIESLKRTLGIASAKKNYYDILFGELSNSEWVALACASFWIALFTFVLPVLFKRKKSSYKFLGIFSSAIFILSIIGVIYWSEHRNTAISISSDALLKLSPAENAPNIAPLSEGKSAIIRKEKNGYMMLQTPDGKWGWAKPELIKKVRE